MSGPKSLMGKGPAWAKFGLSFYPQAKGSWTKAPRPLDHCPKASPRPFLFEPCSWCPSLYFLLLLCDGGQPSSNLEACLSSRREKKRKKEKKNPQPCHGSTMRNRKPLKLSRTKGHSLHCRAPQSRGLAKPQPWKPGLRSPQGPHRPGVPGGPQNVATSLWETRGYGSFQFLWLVLERLRSMYYPPPGEP